MENIKIVRSRQCRYCYAASETFNPEVPISEPLAQILPSLLPSSAFPFQASPLLLSAGTGSGKTRAIIDVVIPFAASQGLPICVISSRAAISTQFKVAVARKLGLEKLLENYTHQGLRRLSQIGPIRILTYHALWSSLCSGDEWVKDIGVLVFDEFHALALDALFVSYTGQLLQKIPVVFRKAIRLYISATPEPIIDALLQVEGNERLSALRWPANYANYRLNFFSEPRDIVNKLNMLPSDEHALVFVSSISAGEDIARKLDKSYRIVSSKTKENEPEVWSHLLESQALDRQVTLTTTTLDAGVSLTDPALRHIFCVGLEAAAVIQQAGRKRLRTNDRLNLYLWSPSQQQLGHLLRRNSEMISALRSNESEPHRFLRDYILENTLPAVRAMCSINPDLSLSVNPLSLELFLRERDLLSKLLSSEEDYPLDTYWCRVFGQELPKDPTRWLDKRLDESAKKSLLSWLDMQVGKTIRGKDAQHAFGEELKSLYQQAFGPRPNDRADRSWGLSTIKKVLCERSLPYSVESKNGGWSFDRAGRDSSTSQEYIIYKEGGEVE